MPKNQTTYIPKRRGIENISILSQHRKKLTTTTTIRITVMSLLQSWTHQHHKYLLNHEFYLSRDHVLEREEERPTKRSRKEE